MKISLAVSLLALTISGSASAITLNFGNSSGSYSAGGVTATVITSGGSLYYNGLPLVGPGIGVQSSFLDVTGYVSSGKSMTVTFNQAVKLNSVSFASWDGGIDQMTMSYAGGSKSFSNGLLDISTIDTFATGGLLLNGFTLSTTSLLTGTYLNSLDVTPAVPVPSAAWLMGSGLLSLAGWVKRKQARK